MFRPQSQTHCSCIWSAFFHQVPVSPSLALIMWMCFSSFVLWFWLIGIEGIYMGHVMWYRTESGTFKDGNLLVNKDGVQIVSQSDVEAVTFISLNFFIFCSCLFVCFELYPIGLFNCFFFGFDVLILMKCPLWQEGVPEFSLVAFFKVSRQKWSTVYLETKRTFCLY